jgi:hypothetical protein
MRELIKQHFGSVVIAVAILLAVIIHAFATRYAAVHHSGVVIIVDHWTGKVRYP